jgi:chloramphenicol 3-O-phosphotransferase
MDAFLDMLPEEMLPHPDGLLLEAAQDDGKLVIAIRSGPVLERAMRGMRHAVAAMAAQLEAQSVIHVNPRFSASGNALTRDQVFILGQDPAQTTKEIRQAPQA